jgi:excisionase family DNA binding protein
MSINTDVKELRRRAVTIREAAEMLAVSMLTIRRAIQSGKIRAFQFHPGGPYRISIEEIENLIQCSSSKAGSPQHLKKKEATLPGTDTSE